MRETDTMEEYQKKLHRPSSGVEASKTMMTKPTETITAYTGPKQTSFLVDDHPIRSLEIPLCDHPNELHHLVWLVVKLDRAIQTREMQASVTGQSWVDGLHASLSRAVNGASFHTCLGSLLRHEVVDKGSIPLAQSQCIFRTLQQYMAANDISMDGAWRSWLVSEFKRILRLGSLAQPPCPLSLQHRRKCLVLDLDRTLWFRSFHVPVDTWLVQWHFNVCMRL
ncbi:hypothetical protein DYB37_011147 [Aphanomyces astaci]|uniref:Uncharacterized protein n=1 Tax=Aphanomyces astaci TaxID=112090 RepID=A0A3R6XZ86_APHAT|nr:hypothetical protein DYB37_011147 [Aphanomyces astaci]